MSLGFDGARAKPLKITLYKLIEGWQAALDWLEDAQS